MPPLELHPSAFRAEQGSEEYDELIERVNSAELQSVDLGNGESLFFQDDEELDMAVPAYVMETGEQVYITRRGEGWVTPSSSPQAPIKKGWLNRILGRENGRN